MAQSRYLPDRGLTARMGGTIFLLGALFVVLGSVLVYYFSYWGVIFIGGFLVVQWFYSDRIALYSMGGREVTPEEAPQLHAIVDRLCALADMPKPKVAIADTDVPNAFATGRSPSRAVVCATTGIMRRLDERELEGVLSHELSHVAHRDVTVMTLAAFVGVLAGFLTRMALYSGMFGGRRNNNNGGAPIILIITLVSIIVYALSFLLTRTLSRYRELAADRAGAFLTGQPSALASALVKISGEMGRIPTKDLRQAEPFNAFFFTPAVAPGFSISSLFSTHPPLEKRLDQLGKISAQLNRPA
ncbi:MAG: heat shock protein HtpX [Actinomycetota bacterium]|jgi:heat shock protein HtpX|nr:heat shock protein HtpX [Actinomycetota bacterium]